MRGAGSGPAVRHRWRSLGRVRSAASFPPPYQTGLPWQPRLTLSRPWLVTAGGGCVGRDPDRGSLERLLDERGQDLMRAAVALTGSCADGEDLLQAALERLLRNWRRVDTDPEGYLRRTLYNLAADGWRSRGRWRSRLAEFRAQAPSETASEDV